MVVYVKASPTAGQRSGDWVVTTDGGKTISRHRLKSRAVDRAKSEARQRDTSYRVQDTSGQWSQGPSF